MGTLAAITFAIASFRGGNPTPCTLSATALFMSTTVTQQDYCRLLPGIQRTSGHQKGKGGLCRVFAAMKSNEELACHVIPPYFHYCPGRFVGALPMTQ